MAEAGATVAKNVFWQTLLFRAKFRRDKACVRLLRVYLATSYVSTKARNPSGNAMA